MSDGKCTEEIKVRITPEMREFINRMAIAEDRAPSELVRHVLSLYLFGHARTLAQSAPHQEGPNVP
jgi:hypothetical protein